MLRPFIVISFMSGATAALAEPVPLTNDALKATVSGSLVEIDTPLGTKLPVRFGDDGLVSAEAGELAPILGAPKDRGRWWVEGDRLCAKWFRWFDAEVRCLTIAQDGSRIYWRKDNGETGTATLVERGSAKREKPAAPQPAPSVVARSEKAPAKQKDIPEPAGHAPPTEKPAPAPASAPTVMASADAAPAADEPAADESYDVPMMRFGGVGLLEASARVAHEPAAPPEQSVAPERAPKAPPRAAETQPEKATDAKATVVAHLPPAAAPKRPAPQKRPADAGAKPPGNTSPGSSTSLDNKAPSGSAFLAAPRMGHYRVRGVDPYDVLNVRRGPSETHAQIAGIPSTGRQVEITGPCQGDWCPIRYGSIRGWVHSFYLAEDRPSRSGSSSPVYVARP